jgi:hypothetical protein
VLEPLDWPALGEIYFHWGGEHSGARSVPPCDRRTRRTRSPGACCRKLPRGGASLWVGAGVAELPVLLAEVMLHGRDVIAANLRERECEVLNAGLQAAAPTCRCATSPATRARSRRGRTFDHLGCISVFTDPETWPVLSDVAYGRIAPVQIDVERFVAEREAGARAGEGLFARLRGPG